MLSFNSSGKGVCNNFSHLSSVSNRLMVLNLVEELESYEIFYTGSTVTIWGE